jgi:hypothetical protein
MQEENGNLPISFSQLAGIEASVFPRKKNPLGNSMSLADASGKGGIAFFAGFSEGRSRPAGINPAGRRVGPWRNPFPRRLPSP